MLKMLVVGMVTKQPEHKVSAKGLAYLKFQVEVPQGQGNWPKRVYVTVFGKQADNLATRLNSNDLVSLSGEPQARGYKDKLNEARGMLELVAEQVTVLAEGARATQRNEPVRMPEAAIMQENTFNPSDDLPF